MSHVLYIKNIHFTAIMMYDHTPLAIDLIQHKKLLS